MLGVTTGLKLCSQFSKSSKKPEYLSGDLISVIHKLENLHATEWPP
jgi:hypothetical protein